MVDKSSRSGFTLLELMLVVIIIGIIAAIAIPGLLQARISGNEASAISTLRAVTSSNAAYRSRFGSFAASMDDLYSTGYLDQNVANPFKAGYTFTYVPAGRDSFATNADPTDPGQSGNRYFFVDATGVIRFSYTAPATPGDPPI